jgi:methyl-accepting chemotaxis protein
MKPSPDEHAGGQSIANWNEGTAMTFNFSVGAKIGGGFAVALAVLGIIGVIGYKSTSGLIEAAEQRSHTYSVLAKLDALIAVMQAAETGQRGYVLTGQDRYLEPYRVANATVDAALAELRGLISENPGQQRRLDAIQPMVKAKLEELKLTIDLRKSKGFDAALAVVLTDQGKQAMDDIRKAVSAMEVEENALLQQRDARVNTNAQSTLSIIAYGIPLAFVVVGIVGFLVTRNISHPLQRITASATQIATGDLGVKLMPLANRSDEIGALNRAFESMIRSLQAVATMAKQIAAGDLTMKVEAQSERDAVGTAFAKMVDSLRDVTREIREGANVVAASAGEIVASTAQVASGSAETAAAVSQTTTTVEEVKQTSRVATDKARQVSETAQRTAQISQTGRKSVEESIDAMHRIQEQMESIAESIVRLSEQGQAIGEIIATVNDLAEQSNLLAVNAAVEAAKAGEQGRGFAVVAQEVKSLAGQSKQATGQVRSILGDIQKATSSAVMAAEQGSKAVELGVKLSAQVRDTIASLSESIEDSARAASQITASAQQQMVGMDQVALAMQNVKQASVQNVAGTKQSESAAQNLQDLGLRLKQVVEQYRL